MYGTTYWLNARAAQLRRQPLCALCFEHGLVVPASVVHHVERHDGNWELFVKSKLQSLCKVCHDSAVHSEEQFGFNKGADVNGAPLDPNKFAKLKAKRERQYSIPYNLMKSGIDVVLVHGAPGSGKTTYARAALRKGSDDIIIDFDDIYTKLGTTWHNATAVQKRLAFKMRDALLYSLHRRVRGTCYFIVMAPTRDERIKWCAALGRTTLHHCNTDKQTCIERIRKDVMRNESMKVQSILSVMKYFKDFVQ